MSKHCPYCKRVLRLIRRRIKCTNEICGYRRLTKKSYVYDPTEPKAEDEDILLKLFRKP